MLLIANVTLYVATAYTTNVARVKLAEDFSADPDRLKDFFAGKDIRNARRLIFAACLASALLHIIAAENERSQAMAEMDAPVRAELLDASDEADRRRGQIYRSDGAARAALSADRRSGARP